MSLTLSLDFQFTTSVEKLWSALTDASQLTKWFTENNFRPVVGHRFQFRLPPMNGWNGLIEGEVLIVEAPHRLSYTWESGEKHTVTWTLQDLGDGRVNLHLEQTGIENEQGRQGAQWGWTTWCGQLAKLLEQ